MAPIWHDAAVVCWRADLDAWAAWQERAESPEAVAAGLRRLLRDF